MVINTQYIQMLANESITNYTEKKLNKLAEKYDWIIRAKVTFKKENDPKGKGKICEIELSLPGPKVFAFSNEKDFQMAVKETLQDLDKQLKKRKGIMKPHL